MRLAALQMRAVGGDVEANFTRIAQAARDAAEAGADLMVTPELALTGYGAGEAIRALAEPADGPLVARLAQLARANGIGIVAGFPERDGDDIYNSVVFTSGEAAPVVYRKAQLYGDYERGLFRPGPPAAVAFEHAGVRCGLLICYDVEFPEAVRRLAFAGAQAVLVATALPISPTAPFIARSIIPVRAFENQVFVAYVDHCGSDERFSFCGLSHVAAPDGTTLALAGVEDEELLIAEIEPSDYAASAELNTYLRDLVL